MPRILLPAFVLLLAPGLALAEDARCRHAKAHDLALDIGDARIVRFEIGASELKLDAAPGAAGRVHGRACASSADALAQLVLIQERIGDRLVVRAAREGSTSGIFFGNRYAHFELSASVPDDVLVQLKVGSGDATATGADSLSIDLGSGDVEARRIRGLVTAKVGSGDILLEDIGALQLLSIGSGDVEARRVRGAVEVGSIGSGEFELDGAAGRVEIGSIGSGDASVRGVAGDVLLGSIGSGDFEASGVRGGLTVRSSGSGSIQHRDVAGTVDLPRGR